MNCLVILMMMIAASQSNKRVLRIYTKAADAPAYLQQLQILKADAPGLIERDLVIRSYVSDRENASNLKKRQVYKHFTVILVGKDGSEKYRDSQPISLRKLYGLIDAMPMRKEEMKRHADQ